MGADALLVAVDALPVAVDAMGGDHAPEAVVKGALLAAAADIPVSLFGSAELIEPLLTAHAADLSSDGTHIDDRAADRSSDRTHIGDRAADLITVVEASEVIGMSEDSARAARNKKDSSLMRAIAAVRDKTASAVVSAGNTGAAAAGSLLALRRLRGVARPAIATPVPVPNRQPVVLLDAGAMADCQPGWMHQFARMGAAYSRVRFGIQAPTVGLLSIGEEPEKGSTLVKTTHKLLAADDKLNFVGNVEGRDVLAGTADVVVTDGFTGNVVLKTLEGSLGFIADLVTKYLGADQEIGPAALKLLAPLADQIDPDLVGGAMLLGVRGVSIISHGSSSPFAIFNAIRGGHEMATAGLLEELALSVQDVEPASDLNSSDLNSSDLNSSDQNSADQNPSDQNSADQNPSTRNPSR